MKTLFEFAESLLCRLPPSGARATIVLALGLLTAAGTHAAPTGKPLADHRFRDGQMVRLSIGEHRMTAEVVVSAAAQAKGLMGRTDLAPDGGMLFDFGGIAAAARDGSRDEPPQRRCMWMKNTPLPLSVAFIDAAGRILNLAKMQSFSETVHCSIAPVRYALEAHQGWFANRGIRAGARITVAD